MTTVASEHDRPRDAVSGAWILVGDMISWSDLASLDTPVAAAEVIGSMIREERPRRVLLAGPRAGLLVTSLPDDIAVDLLVRSLPDVRVLGDIAGLHPKIELYCGGFDAFAPGHGYDLVVAFGGPAKLLGPDSRGLSERELLSALVGHLDDGGRLVVDIGNGLGLDDLITAEAPDQAASDAAWHIGADGFDGRQLYAHERDEILGHLGLHPHAVYAALPTLDRHSLLVATGSEGPTTDVEQVSRYAGRTMGVHLADQPMLRDPRPTLARVVEAGQLDQLAPSWLVVAGKASADDGQAKAVLPRLVDVETALAPAWAVVTTVAGDGQERQRWADGHVDSETTSGTLSRTLGVPTTSGDQLDVLLRQACATRRHATVRALVRRYADWLADQQQWAGERAGSRFFATTENVIVGESLQLADASWRRSATISTDQALVHGLRDFARRLLASASAHPWSPSVTPDELTVTLGAMAGLTVTAAHIEAVALTEAEIEAVRLGVPHEVNDLFHLDLDQGRHARDLPSADSVGYRELLTRERARTRVLRETRGQVLWLEGTLRHRDRYIRTLELLIERFEETLTYRTVQAIRAPRRIATEKAVSLAKSTAEDALPPGAMSKARQLVSKVLR